MSERIINSGFYSYLWLREKDGTFPAGTPYYAGKGKGDRGFVSDGHTVLCPKDKSFVLVMPRADEEEAFKSEIELIANWGRLDLGTGCLRNRTNGGDGPTGRNPSEESRKKMSMAKKGKPSPKKGKPGHTPSLETRAKMSTARKGIKYSLETINKMSIAAKKRGICPNTRAAAIASLKGKPWSESRRRAQSNKESSWNL